MKKINKTFAVVLSVSLLLTFAPLSALADPAVVAEGNLTDTVTWRVTDDGVLTIGGSGAIPNYSSFSTVASYYQNAPYYAYADQITSLVIEEGITSIGMCAFYLWRDLRGDLVIPDSVTRINDSAFDSCGFDGHLTLGSENSHLQLIDDHAFWRCGFTGDLIIPDSVSVINFSAFNGCSGFNGTLSLGRGNSQLSKIDKTAFSGCSGFTGELVIPDSVTWIGISAFSSCSGFSKLTLGTGNSQLQTICDTAFYHCTGFSGNLIIPNSVTTIRSSAFSSCSGFTGDLVIPDSISTIADGVFYFCTGFNGNLVIPNSVTSIGVSAFGNCSGLTGNLVIPDSVTSIGESAFKQCAGFNGTLTLGTASSQLQSIGDYAFSRCNNFTGNLVIPDSVTSIGESAFYSCSGFNGTLTLGTANSRLQTIGNNAFYQCSNFTGNLVVPDLVTSIGTHAFKLCTGFNGTLILGTNNSRLQSIGSDAFFQCRGFTGDLVIPDSVVSIGPSAFARCDGLNGTLTLGTENSHLQTIDAGAFQYCSNLTGNIVIPDSVTSIIGNAFDSCFGFNGTLTLGSQLQIIDRYTFCSCTGLTGDLVIPDSVTEIGESAFSGCGFNGTLTLGSEESHLQSIGNQAFWTCSGFTGDLVLPDTVTNVDAYAFYSCTGFNGALTIGDAVETIGNKAFMGCTNLTGKLTIKNPETVFGTCALHGCAKDTDILTFFADHPEFIEVIQTAYTAPTITSDGSVSYKVNCTDPGHTTDAQKYITSVTKTIPYIFIDAITPDPAEVSLWPGETAQLGTTVTPLDAMDPNVTFTSDDTGVVTVADTGLLTAVTPGTATITIVPADTSDSATATVSVTVKQPVTEIRAEADRYVLDMEDAPYAQITVTVLPDEADNKNVIYTSSDPSVLDVDADGLVIALHQGTATLIITAADGYGAETTIDFTVTHDLYALRVGPTVEEEETGEATVETNTARTFTVQYASSDPDVLEIAPETGAFTAKKKGTVTVTAELDFEDGGHKTLSQDVVVRDPHEGEFRCSRCDWYDEVKDAPGIRGIVYWMIHTITHFVQLINSMT